MPVGHDAAHSVVPSIKKAPAAHVKQLVLPAPEHSAQRASQARQLEESKKKPELQAQAPLVRVASETHAMQSPFAGDEQRLQREKQDSQEEVAWLK